jgi:hypothetical protein
MPRSAVYEIPVLRRRRHLRPERGGCLVEIASTLPGGRWTDRPASVDPVLAAVARAVNDRTSAAGRGRLLPLAPWLITGGQPSGDGTAAALGCLAGQAVLARIDGKRIGRAIRQLATLSAGADSVRWARWGRWRQQRRAMALVRLAVRTLSAGPDADATLRVLLFDSINETRRLEGLPSIEFGDTPGIGWPTTLPVRVEMQVRDGADSTYFHCAALIDQWPPSLAKAWRDRVRELGLAPQPVSAAAPARSLVSS